MIQVTNVLRRSALGRSALRPVDGVSRGTGSQSCQIPWDASRVDKRAQAWACMVIGWTFISLMSVQDETHTAGVKLGKREASGLGTFVEFQYTHGKCRLASAIVLKNQVLSKCGEAAYIVFNQTRLGRRFHSFSMWLCCFSRQRLWMLHGECGCANGRASLDMSVSR